MGMINVVSKREAELKDLGVRVDECIKINTVKGIVVGAINATIMATLKDKTEVPLVNLHLPVKMSKAGNPYIQSDYDQYKSPNTGKTYSSVRIPLDIRKMLLDHWTENASARAEQQNEVSAAE